MKIHVNIDVPEPGAAIDFYGADAVRLWRFILGVVAVASQLQR